MVKTFEHVFYGPTLVVTSGLFLSIRLELLVKRTSI